MSNFQFLSEKPTYTHRIGFTTCEPEVYFQYDVETYVEDWDNIQFICMCLGNMFNSEFSEDILNIVTNNIRNHPDIVRAELIEVETI